MGHNLSRDIPFKFSSSNSGKGQDLVTTESAITEHTHIVPEHNETQSGETIDNLVTTESAITEHTHIVPGPNETQSDETIDKKVDESHSSAHVDNEENPSKPSTLCVIAIDIGTTRTGYAFSFDNQGNGVTLPTYGQTIEQNRVPTILLLKPDKTFHSFGNEAQHAYVSMVDTERKSHIYLERIKLRLFNKLSDDREICEQFSLIIKHIKDLSMGAARLQVRNLKEEHVRWVITIPAI